ncbi:hypothetical protein M752DRAFT_291458 [Aspergillus phoenicis ATCC 13157]|uniref:Uncharacterized protein n=1 Tax=Aspergillus phoenicis ATCC 13157 TaxID=1353007 RepID=A0A370PQX0_ASPPH|nr:hypothetical protein M752DRAFT_291458 [Aspergillus phoenicis ATCC 13157]
MDAIAPTARLVVDHFKKTCPISKWASVLALKFEPVLVLGGVALRPAGYAASTVWYGNHASIRGFAVIDDKVPKGTVQPSSGCHVRG